MASVVKITSRPKLKSPNLIAAWPGVGNVAVVIANYLKAKLPFKELGYLDAPAFFDPIGVQVKDNVVEAPTFPQSRFAYWKNPAGEHDLILFTGDDQPAAKSYELANAIIDVAVRFGVERVYTCAAAITRIHHTEPPKVWGVGTSHLISRDLAKYHLEYSRNLQIAGLNGLLLGVAKEREMDGVCFLGEVPQYASRVTNPMAALAVMKVLVKALGVTMDFAELAKMAVDAQERLKQVAAQAMEEYIDNFTEPIWEREEEDFDEDEEDDEGGLS
jgi:proteasome assembly chaperone (PAC2) family protein